MTLPTTTFIHWTKTYRLINSCYPPCNVYEDILAHSEDWELAIELEMMTNPRVRDELGEITLIPKHHRITGTDSWWVTSAFTHINPNGSRFTDGTYGAYYAANNFLTALKEKAHGSIAEFMKATDEPIIDITCRTLVGTIENTLHDIRDTAQWQSCYAPDDYSQSQKLATTLREQESNGIVYKSVRHKKGECFAAFWPDVVTIPIQERHVTLHWNGEHVTAYFEMKEDTKRWAVL